MTYLEWNKWKLSFLTLYEIPEGVSCGEIDKPYFVGIQK